MRQLKLDLAQAYREEELYKKQRCRENWLRDGDKNTKFFHNCVKGRKFWKWIQLLIDQGMGWNSLQREGLKGNIVVDYFRGSSNPSNIDTLFEGFNPRFSQEMNRMLVANVTETEIKAAAFAIDGGSSPGADGFSGNFYQRFWAIVGLSIIVEGKEFFWSYVFTAYWNYTQICLLPKVSNPTRMTKLRPISLSSVHYKIVSKILCDRVKHTLPDLVLNTRSLCQLI